MLRRLTFWTAWYLPLVVLWLAFVDTLAGAEVAVGLVAAAIAATAAELVRSQGLVRFHLEPRWRRGLAGIPRQVVGDTWLLAVALWRHLTGRPAHGAFRVVAFPSEADDARSAARRARGLHSGGIGDSVTWLVVGMATFGTLLAVVLR